MDLKPFKHTFTLEVRNYEVDWQGIVHNGNYLLYFEVARLDYFKHLGVDLNQRTINSDIKLVAVRNELDYLSQATFGDRLIIHTRIVSINNSSLVTESVMLFAGSDTMVAKNRFTLVWLNPVTNTSMRVPDYFRTKVQQFEGDDAAVQGPAVD